MPDLVVILVEPEKADNVGMIARAMKNFGFRRLRIVRPMFESFDRALAAAMHAKDVIEEAEILTTLEEAREGVDLLIGTTARVSRYSLDRRAIPIRDFLREISWNATYGLVMGRESVGLTTDELAFCDVVTTIPSSEEYPALNLANATAIFLYEFYLNFKDSTRFQEKPVPREVRELMVNYIRDIVSAIELADHKRERVIPLIRRIVERTFPCGMSAGEATYLVGVIKAVRDRLVKVR